MTGEPGLEPFPGELTVTTGVVANARAAEAMTDPRSAIRCINIGETLVAETPLRMKIAGMWLLNSG